MGGLVGKKPFLGVFLQTHIQDFDGQVQVLGLVSRDKGSHIDGIKVVRVQLGDDLEDIVEVQVAVWNRVVAVVLDGPDIDQIGQERRKSECPVFEVFPFGKVDDGRAGDFFAQDPVGDDLQIHEDTACQDQKKHKKYCAKTLSALQSHAHDSQMKSLFRKMRRAMVRTKRV